MKRLLSSGGFRRNTNHRSTAPVSPDRRGQFPPCRHLRGTTSHQGAFPRPGGLFRHKRIIPCAPSLTACLIASRLTSQPALEGSRRPSTCRSSSTTKAGLSHSPSGQKGKSSASGLLWMPLFATNALDRRFGLFVSQRVLPAGMADLFEERRERLSQCRGDRRRLEQVGKNGFVDRPYRDMRRKQFLDRLLLWHGGEVLRHGCDSRFGWHYNRNTTIDGCPAAWRRLRRAAGCYRPNYSCGPPLIC